MASLGGAKNSTWHFALGSTLSQIKTRPHLLAAAAQLHHAVESSEGLEAKWRSYQELADVYKDLGEYQDAIAAASKALEIIPAYNFYNKLLAQLIQNTNLQLGERQEAFENSFQAWESAPRDPIAAFNMIFAAHRTGRYSETVRIMKSALESKEEARFLGGVIRVMTPQRYTTEYMSIACAKLGELDTARDAFIAVRSQAAELDDLGKMAEAEAALARLYHSFYQDDSAAIELFENIVKGYSATVSAFSASHVLASVYFTNAKESSNPVETQTWVSKLEKLVDLVESMSGDPGMFPTKDEASALLGKWYAQHGQMDQARTKIQPMIKRAILELTDRDESNDYEAYNNLARGLLCSGDRISAAIAFAFTKPLQKSKELPGHESCQPIGHESTSETAHEISDDQAFNFIGRCDGGCARPEQLFKSFSICEVCVDVAFCDECYRKLMDGTTEFRMCDPRHPHLELYPPKGLVTREAGGYMIHLDGKKVDFDEWLGMINRQWL